jgi:hypothetical protein
VAFSPDGQFMAMLHREDCKDRIGVYYCHDWTAVTSFRLDSVDAEQLMWTSDSAHLLVRDTPLEYSLFVYSVKGREHSRN